MPWSTSSQSDVFERLPGRRYTVTITAPQGYAAQTDNTQSAQEGTPTEDSGITAVKEQPRREDAASNGGRVPRTQVVWLVNADDLTTEYPPESIVTDADGVEYVLQYVEQAHYQYVTRLHTVKVG